VCVRHKILSPDSVLSHITPLFVARSSLKARINVTCLKPNHSRELLMMVIYIIIDTSNIFSNI
jgi:hypothetical protein